MKPFQLRAARAILRLGVRDVAEAAGVTAATITRFETEKGGLQMASLEKIRIFYEASGVIFIAENGEGPGVRLRKERPGGASFRSFVMRAPITSDPVGDFIRDARLDREMPDAKEWQEVLSHLERIGASAQAISAGEAAWERYLAEKGRQE